MKMIRPHRPQPPACDLEDFFERCIEHLHTFFKLLFVLILSPLILVGFLIDYTLDKFKIK